MSDKIKMLRGIAAWAFVQEPAAASNRNGIESPAQYRLDLIVDKAKGKELKAANLNVKLVDEAYAKPGSGLEPHLGKARLAIKCNVETKAGKKNLPPKLKDSQNNLITQLVHEGRPVKIGNGTEVVVAYREYEYKPKKVMAQLIGVQIIKLLPYVTEVAFDKVEGGYTGEPNNSVTGSSVETNEVPWDEEEPEL